MSLQPLTWRPEATQIRDFSWRVIKRRSKLGLRRLNKYLRGQYYLSSALADTKRAVGHNEDIALGGLFIMVTLSFATISVLANLILSFVVAASILSTESGFNIALLLIAAFGVMAVLSMWLGAFLQNIWMYALYEGATRKQYRSLRRTVRNSLHTASQTAIAWGGLFVAAATPGVIANATGLGLVALFHPQLTGIIGLILAVEIIALVWATWVLVNYSLLPQVALFGQHTSWIAAAKHAKRLVSRKGRVFAFCAYLACAIGLGVAYLLARGLHHAVGSDTTLGFMLLALAPLTATNAAFTMLYRKRRLARS